MPAALSLCHTRLIHKQQPRLYSSTTLPRCEYRRIFGQTLPFVKSHYFRVRWTAAKVGIVFVLGSVSLSTAYATASHELDEKRLKDILVRGTCPSVNVEVSDFVRRPSVEAALERMVTPSKKPANYFVVVGETGSGKSTMMKAACSKVGGGVIYVDVPEKTRNFGDAFADAIGFKFHTPNNLSDWFYGLVYGPGPPLRKERWELPYEKFKELASWYRSTYGITPVLVIDNSDFLAKDSEKVLEILQRGAKGGIDENLFVAVFVAADGATQTHIESRSAFSRGKLYRVGDLDDSQIKDFLNKRKVDPAIHDQVRDLVGGRVLLLSIVCEELNAGTPFEHVRADRMKDVEKRIGRVVNPHNQYVYESILRAATSKRVFKAVDCEIKKAAVTEEEFLKLELTLEKLVVENVLSKVDAGYSFHSNVERAYCMEN
ncbi:hypothetical protein BCR33DRAFT_713596 [Rhizoclosmatium globosum]|uniref:AAA+ ATPase domain-containing protein n=1 Tax=Rhizoclosmatium globosum TaxID=329046 RepID=A0A1Y2CSP9_9FUNG|nr:hypothetical protein BCR33DRAFT_713596 [Rhizoclosmatium globosum]|eukprot:ORY50003.1 hypothetical protein BCR33DRAFT_713596 [Rhizoclosmatium globosum]